MAPLQEGAAPSEFSVKQVSTCGALKIDVKIIKKPL